MGEVKRRAYLMNTTIRLRAWLKHLATRNFVGLLPPFVKAIVVAVSGAVQWEQLAVPTGLGSRFRAAYRAFKRDRVQHSFHPMFAADWYMSRYGLQGRPEDAFVHFLLIGDRLGLQPHPWFDTRFVREVHRLSPIRNVLAWYGRQQPGSVAAHPHFEPTWYLRTNDDVAASRVDPLVHFVLHGQAEGRSPNGYFDAGWYRARNPDVKASGLPPALHFALYGGRELRDPGPEFSARTYCASCPDRKLHGRLELDPLGHYLAIGRPSGVVLALRALTVDELCARPAAITASPGIIDVVLPVYRGLGETRACIQSVLAARSVRKVRLRIYNDASPEQEVTSFLRDLAMRNPEITLVENPENLGFVGTVNNGMRAAMSERDFECVILLNSDTIVSSDWVDRLAAHALREDGIATVTALSNNATICSYPHIGANSMPVDADAAAVDAAAAEANAGCSVDIPTGVGFCMLITRRALERVGLFDEDAFGRGYGEENDFCMKAAAAGFYNRLALDVFVQHVGEVSFAEVSKPGKLVAEEVIRARYPDYQRRVADYCSRDPALVARVRITLALWRRSKKPVYMLVTHDVGGGTERHVQERATYLRAQAHVVIARPAHRGGDAIRLQNDDPFDSFDVEVGGLDGEGLARLLTTLGVDHVEIHHVLGFGPAIREGIAIAKRPFDFVVHDYYTICPQVTLSPVEGVYCGEPDQFGCNACIARRPSHGASDIWNWRTGNAWLVEGAVEVRAPSHDTARRMQRYFGRDLKVVPHEPGIARVARGRPTHGGSRPITVLVLGTLAAHKGKALIIDAAVQAQSKGRNLRFHLIGDPQGDVPTAALGRLTWTGRYDEGELETLIAEAQGSAILFASPIPETYSYTLTAAMRSGLPIVATEIGAFPERLAGYGDVLLVAADIGGGALVDALGAFLLDDSARTETP